MMNLKVTPLPDELLIEIGKFATTWTAIEQMIVLDTLGLHGFRERYKNVEKVRRDFKNLREAWFKINKETRDECVHLELKQLNDRLAKAAKARGYALHGVWEDVRHDTFWKLYGGKEFRAIWWEQDKKDGNLQMVELPTDLRDLQVQTAMLEQLRQDLLKFFNTPNGPENLPDSFFQKK